MCERRNYQTIDVGKDRFHRFAFFRWSVGKLSL